MVAGARICRIRSLGAERGVVSERAWWKLAVVEMHVQGVSTGKVPASWSNCAAFEVTSSQVSRASPMLDEELSAQRTRPLGKPRYVTRKFAWMAP